MRDTGFIQRERERAIRKAQNCHRRGQTEMEAYWCGAADVYIRIIHRIGVNDDGKRCGT